MPTRASLRALVNDVEDYLAHEGIDFVVRAVILAEVFVAVGMLTSA